MLGQVQAITWKFLFETKLKSFVEASLKNICTKNLYVMIFSSKRNKIDLHHFPLNYRIQWVFCQFVCFQNITELSKLSSQLILDNFHPSKEKLYGNPNLHSIHTYNFPVDKSNSYGQGPQLAQMITKSCWLVSQKNH